MILFKSYSNLYIQVIQEAYYSGHYLYFTKFLNI